MVNGDNRGKALRRLWNGRCVVYVTDTVTNPVNGRAEPIERAILADEPCRLSYKSVSPAIESGGAAVISQSVKLFLRPDAEIPHGSKIVVTQNGATDIFVRSGEPAVYSQHQELEVVRKEERA